MASLGRPVSAVGPKQTVVSVLERIGGEELLAAGVFFAPGTIASSVRRSSRFLDPGDAAAASEREAVANRLPQVVVLAIFPDSVSIYPADTSGRVKADALLVLPNGAYRAAMLRRVFIVRIQLDFESHHIRLEGKTFPFGPNRHTKAIAEMLTARAIRPISRRGGRRH
jgi:hypothetical protein